MGLAKPVFTRQEAEALATAAEHILNCPDTSTRALGENPQKILDAKRALDKLQQHLPTRPRK